MRTRTFLCLLVLGAACSGAAHAEEASPPAPVAEKAEAPSAAKEPEKSDGAVTWYAQVLATGPAGLNVTQFWSKGPYLRAETIIGGHKIVTIVRDEWYYAYDATRASGIRVRRAKEARARDAPYRRPFGNDALKLIQRGAEKVGEEVFHGREAIIYRLTDRLGRRTVWATKDALNIPLRVEFYNRKLASKQYTDYTDWLTGLTLPDRYFKPDPVVLLESYEFEEYGRELARIGTVGPVPVLYNDLLRGH